MNVPDGLTPRLTTELNALNASQLAAVLHDGSMVVRAGPGSGKTRTLVAKAAYTLEAVLPSRRGLAAITYTRHAAQEMTSRLNALDVQTGDRLAAGTLHGWCLHRILQPFGPLAGIRPPGVGDIFEDSSDEWIALLQECLDETTTGSIADREKQRVIRIRRRLAAGLPQDHRDPLVRAAILLDERMHGRRWYDFDLMVAQSLNILRREPRVTHLIAARFPVIIIDEYQDLGPVLHELVTHLRDHGNADVVAFGDPDQTIMRFAGANPAYLKALADRSDFADTTLNINYRCGAAIIAASHTAVDGRRTHEADPTRRDPGIIELVAVQGDERDHADMTMTKIDELVANDVPEHHIAVLYTSKGRLLDELTAVLDRSIYDYIHENNRRLPASNIVDFVRACAARAIAGPQPIGYPKITHASTVSTIRHLTASYQALHTDFELPSPHRRSTARLIAGTLHAAPPETDLSSWLQSLDETLGLTQLGRQSPQRRDRDAIKELKQAAEHHALIVGDIAGALRTGKITLTTYHAAKGREWEYVILPGLVDGLMPRKHWNRTDNDWVLTKDSDYEQARSSFYVGLTRAKRAAILIEGTLWHSHKGILNQSSPSTFVSSIREHAVPAAFPATGNRQ